MIIPPKLRPSDLIAIVAPSSPFDEPRFLRGVSFLASRYRLRMRDDLNARSGYLAGDDLRRRTEMVAALSDDSVRAIVAVRGGYGALRIVDAIDWKAFAQSPKWIVGFSDITAFHAEASRQGVASMHAQMVAGLGDADESQREDWITAVESQRIAPFTGLRTITEGRAKGRVFGGNLALLEACAAAGRLFVPRGALLFVEDCTERPYRIDRMLTSLLLGGHLANIAGIVVGGLTDCPPGADGVTADAVIRERLSSLAVPMVTGAPFGHGEHNRPFIIGGMAEVIADKGEGRVNCEE
ncbi:MAG: LD-carboxypeptidase [Polyangiales bacterium]